MLKIRLDDAATASLAPETIRVFSYHPTSRTWRLVAHSGVSSDRTYAWARLTRSGIFVALGLPRDEWLLAVVVSTALFAPWIKAASENKSQKSWIKSLAALLTSAAEARAVSAETADALGIAVVEGRPTSASIRRAIERLDLPRGGLPESILLDELPDTGLPPWWRLPLPWPPSPWPVPLPHLLSRWVSVGPSNISGRILSLAIHPIDGDIVYAGSANGGVWLTYDGGASWRPTMFGEESMAISALAISPSAPYVLYAATGEDYEAAADFAGAGVYKTVDGGTTWKLLAPIASDRCTQVVVDGTDPDTVFVAGNQGLDKSTDGGLSWTTVLSGHITDVAIDPVTPTIAYAAAASLGLYRSTDAGHSWEPVYSLPVIVGVAGWTRLAAARRFVSAEEADPRSGFVKEESMVVAKTGPTSSDLYRSTDHGATWSPIRVDQPEVIWSDPQRPYADFVAINPDDPKVIFSGMVYKNVTFDGGATWNSDPEDGSADTHVDHHAAVFSSTEANVCFLATDGGVYKSVQGGALGTWAPVNSGLATTQFYSVGVSQTPPLVIGGGTQDTGTLAGHGKIDDWFDTRAGTEGGTFVVDPSNSSNLYATPWSDGLVRSTDGGQTWALILDGLGVIDSALVESGGTFADYSTAINVYLFVGGGVPIPGAVGDALYIGETHAFPRFRYLASKLGAGGEMAVEYLANDGFWKSLAVNESQTGAKDFTAPSGASISWFWPNLPFDWQAMNFQGLQRFWIRFRVTKVYTANARLARAFVLPRVGADRLAVSPTNQNVMLCVWQGSLYRTTNQGDEWREVSPGAFGFAHVAFSAAKSSVCFAATEFGQVFRSDSGGSAGTWVEPYAPGGGPLWHRVGALAVDWSDSEVLYLGYSYDGWPLPSRLFRSDDGGAHWNDASGAVAGARLPESPIRGLAVGDDADQICVQTDVGLWFSGDGGTTWADFNYGLPPITVTEIAYQKRSNIVYASTLGRGIYRRWLG
jgi:photosystem II stability/assembly factor-like uncharacterized protein